MRHTWIGVAMLVAASVARPTQAATPAGSWTNGGMLGSETGAVYATIGYPGLNIGYLRGVSDTLDAGGRFTFQYGGEGTPADAPLGLKLAGDVKLKVDLGLPVAITARALPGIGLYFPPGFSVLFLQLPVEAGLGFPVAPNLQAHVSLQVPFGFGYWSGIGGTSFTSVQVPALVGGGLELKVDRALSVTGQLHMGPYFRIFFGGLTQNYFALEALVGVTYRLLPS